MAIQNGVTIDGGNEQGNRMDHLSGLTDVIIDKKNDSILICDNRNRRVMRWSARNEIIGQMIISDIDCCCLTIDDNADLDVSEWVKNEVR